MTFPIPLMSRTTSEVNYTISEVIFPAYVNMSTLAGPTSAASATTMLISRAFVMKSDLSVPSLWVAYLSLVGTLVRCGLAPASYAPYGSSPC